MAKKELEKKKPVAKKSTGNNTNKSNSTKSTTAKKNSAASKTKKVVKKEVIKEEVPKFEAVSRDSVKNGVKTDSKNKPIVGFIIGGAVVLLLILSFFLSDTSSSNKVSVDNVLDDIGISEYTSMLEGNNPSIIYIGRPTCSYCELLKPILNSVADEYDLDVNYLNTDELSDSDHQKLLDSHDYFAEGYGTPLILIVNNGEIVNINEGYVEEATLVDFFVSNGFINESDVVVTEPLVDTSAFVNTTIAEYIALKDGSSPSIIYFGRPTCSYCDMIIPHLNELISTYGITINYVNTDELTSDEFQSMMDSDEHFAGSWGTPLIFIVQNGEKVDMLEGYAEIDTITSLLKDNNIIN